MLAKYRRSLGILAAMAASATWCGSAVAQNISAVPTGAVPSGTGEPLSVNLVNSPDLDTIIGYHFKVSYNNSQVTFDDVADPLGAEAFDGDSGPGQPGDAPASGYSDFVVVEGNTLNPVSDRGNLLQLNFTTGASYTGTLNLHIESYPTPDSGLTVDNGGGDITHVTPIIDNSEPVFVVPIINDLSQHYNVIDEATADYTITVNGSNFDTDAVVEFDGTPLTTSFVNSTQLTATLPFGNVDEVGEWLINVDNGDNVESNSAYYTAVTQATVQVDDDFSGTFEQRIAAGQIFGVNVFNSIQAAENAVDANGTVAVAAGNYVEKVVVDNAGVAIECSTGANLTAPTSGTNGALVDVRASQVTVEGLTLTVNRPYATAGVVIQNTSAGTNYDDLSVIGNTFSVTGTGGNADSFVGFGTQSTAIAARNSNGAQTDITIAGNIIGSAAAPFNRAIFTRVVRGTIGGAVRFDGAGDVATKGNVVYGENHDLCIQFVSTGNMLVQNNALRGWGYDNYKGAQVDFTEPNGNGSIQVISNLFEPQADGGGRIHTRSLMIKNNDGTPNITIQGNEFKLRKVGILAGNSIGTTVNGNVFTPVSGVADSIAVAISNKVPTGGAVAPDPIGATIIANTFNGGDVAGNTAIEFMNHNSTPEPGAGYFGAIVVGMPGNANTFGANLANFIVLNNESGPSSGSSYDWVNAAGLGVTEMTPFAGTIVAKDNLFDLGDGPVSPAGLALDDMIALENKVQHKRDFAALGSVLFYLRVENIDTNEYFDYVQDAIDDSDTDPGHEIAVSAGDYLELIDVTKANLVLTGTGSPVIKAPASASNARLMEILADGVTVDGFDFDMASNVGGSVIAVGRNSLTVQDCDFLLTDATGGTLSGMPGAYGGNWGPKAVVFGGNGPANSTVTLKGNTFASETAAFFMYGAQVYHANALVGGIGESNSFSNAYRDLLLTQTGGTIEYNSFAGNVDVSNSYAAVNLSGNTFGHDAQQHNEAALTIRAVQQPAGSVSVNANQFVNTARAVWVGGSKNVSITGNVFTPDDDITIDAGDSTEPVDQYAHIIVDSSFVTSSNGSATPEVGVTVTGNTFNDNGVGNGVAVELRNTNTNPSTFSTLVFGTAASPNTFNSALSTYVNIADGFVQDVDFTNNYFAGTLGTAFDESDGFAAEDKINHKLDDETLAFVRVKPQHVFVSQNVGSIQAGVDSASSGDTVNVQGGAAYTEDNIELTQPITIDGHDVRVDVDAVAQVVMNPTAGTVTGGSDGFIVKADNVTIRDMSIMGVDANQRYSTAVIRGSAALYSNTVLQNLLVQHVGHWSTNATIGEGKRSGVHLSQPAGTLSTGNQVLDCDFVDCGYAGLRLTAGNTVVTGNQFAQMHYQGLYVQPQGSTEAFVNAQGNTFESSEVAVRVHTPADGSLLQDNTIYLGQFAGTYTSGGNTYNKPNLGIQVEWGHCDVVSNDIIVDATPSAGAHVGVWVWKTSTPSEITGNTFTNLSGSPVATAIAAVGQRLGNLAYSNPPSATDDAGQTNVLIQNNTITGYLRGVAVEHADTSARSVYATINSNNSFVNCDSGIELVGDFADAAIAGNTFTAGASEMYIVNTSANNIDISTNTFGGQLLSSLDPEADEVSFWSLQDQLVDKLDDSENGHLRLADGYVFVPAAKEGIDAASKYVITRSVEAADAGDVIQVQAGNFSGAVVDKLVKVVSASGVNLAVLGSSTLVDIPGGTGEVSIDGFQVNNSSINIDGNDQAGSTFKVANCSFIGGAANTAAVGVSNSVGGIIDNITVSGSAGNGVILANSSNITVKDSDINGNDGSAILVWKWDYLGATPVTADNIKLKNNEIIGNGVTIDTNGTTVNNTEAYGILVARYDDAGIPTAVTGSSATNLEISGNTIRNNAATGVFLSNLSTDGTGSNVVSGNTIQGNGLSGSIVANPTSMKNTDGIKVNSSRNVGVTNNFINDNLRYGILVRSLAGETEAGQGVTVTSNHLDGNEPIDYANNGTLIGAGLTLQLYGNPSTEIAATNNWWGHVYGPYNATVNPVGRGDLYDPQSGTAAILPWYGYRAPNNIWYALNDRDGDGLFDAHEDLSLDGIKQALECDRSIKDSDGDGFEDGVEDALGSDPWDGGVKPNAGHALYSYATSTADDDGDGYKDFYEVAFGTDPTAATGAASYPDLGNITPADPIKMASDLTSLRQVLVGQVQLTHTSVEQQNMDLNRDGYVSNIDAIVLRRFHGGTQALPLK